MAKQTGNRKSPVKESAKESPQPRSANDPRQVDVQPNPDRDVQGDAAQVRTITPGS